MVFISTIVTKLMLIILICDIVSICATDCALSCDITLMVFIIYTLRSGYLYSNTIYVVKFVYFFFFFCIVRLQKQCKIFVCVKIIVTTLLPSNKYRRNHSSVFLISQCNITQRKTFMRYRSFTCLYHLFYFLIFFSFSII